MDRQTDVTTHLKKKKERKEIIVIKISGLYPEVPGVVNSAATGA